MCTEVSGLLKQKVFVQRAHLLQPRIDVVTSVANAFGTGAQRGRGELVGTRLGSGAGAAAWARTLRRANRPATSSFFR